MPKYIYKPILEKVQEVYLENAKKEYVAGFDIESNVRIIIEADNEKLADLSRYGFLDIRMWELVED